MIPVIVALALLVLGAGCILLVRAVENAPLGTEDAEGFHFVEEPRTVASRHADAFPLVPTLPVI